MANVALPVGPLASISGRVDDSKRVERAWASTAGQLECKGGHIRRRKWSGVGRGRVTYLHHTRTVPREGRGSFTKLPNFSFLRVVQLVLRSTNCKSESQN